MFHICHFLSWIYGVILSSQSKPIVVNQVISHAELTYPFGSLFHIKVRWEEFVCFKFFIKKKDICILVEFIEFDEEVAPAMIRNKRCNKSFVTLLAKVEFLFLGTF